MTLPQSSAVQSLYLLQNISLSLMVFLERSGFFAALLDTRPSSKSLRLTVRAYAFTPACCHHLYICTFSHLADAFIQSDLHMCDLQCIHILHVTFTLMAHCTSGAIRGSVSCSRTLRQGIELATFRLLNDFFTSCTTVA